jgi:hypothetical protein
MLIFGVSFIDMRWIQEQWAFVIGKRYWDTSGARPDRPYPFTDIQKIESVRGVKYYLGKYIAKSAFPVDQGESAGSPCERPAALGGGQTTTCGEASPLSLSLLHKSPCDARVLKWKEYWKGRRHWALKGKRFVKRYTDASVSYMPICAAVGAIRMLANEMWPKLGLSDEMLLSGFTLYIEPEQREVWERRVQRCLELVDLRKSTASKFLDCNEIYQRVKDEEEKEGGREDGSTGNVGSPCEHRGSTKCAA